MDWKHQPPRVNWGNGKLHDVVSTWVFFKNPRMDDIPATWRCCWSEYFREYFEGTWLSWYPNHDLHTSYIMNNPEAPDRFSVILGDASHNFSLPSQNLPQHSSVRQIILLLRDAYKSLATHYKQATFSGIVWERNNLDVCIVSTKRWVPCTEGVPYHRSTSCFWSDMVHFVSACTDHRYGEGGGSCAWWPACLGTEIFSHRP